MAVSRSRGQPVSHGAEAGRPADFVTGKGRFHPLLAAAVALVSLLVIGAVGYFILVPQIASGYSWRQAQAALADYDLPRARRQLERCLEWTPRSAEVHFLLARTCRRAWDLDAARAQLQEAERLQAKPADVDLERVLLRAQSGLVERVEEELHRYLGSRPDDETTILEAMLAGYLQGNFLPQAHHWGTIWVERHPDDWLGHYWHGQVLERGLRYDLAAAEYQRALDLKPGFVEAHLRRGEVLLWSGQFPEALPEFRAYLEHVPDSASALFGLAECQRSVEPQDETRATLDRLLALYPDHPGGLLLRGQMELERDNPAEALGWLRKAEPLTPRDRELNQALATALRRLGHEDEARRYEAVRQQIDQDLRRMKEITRTITSQPHDVALRLEAGAILQRLGQSAQAANWLFSAFVLDRDNPEARKALADCIRQLGDPKLVEYYRPILEGTAAGERAAPAPVRPPDARNESP